MPALQRLWPSLGVFIQVFPPTERSNSSPAVVEEGVEEQQRPQFNSINTGNTQASSSSTHNPITLPDMYLNNMSFVPYPDAHLTEPSSSPPYRVRQYDRLATEHPQLRRRPPMPHATMSMPGVQAQPPFPFASTADHQDGQGIANSNQSPPNIRMPSPPRGDANATNASGPSDPQLPIPANLPPYRDSSGLMMDTSYSQYDGGYHHSCRFCSSGFCRLHFVYRGPTRR